MRWLVLGAGALGGYFGGRLIEVGEDVSFLVRERRMHQLRASGLNISSPLGDTHVPAPKCVAAGEVRDPYDVILLGCKAYDLDSAIDAIAPAVGPETGILPWLNGMRHLDRLSQRFGAGHVMGGVAMISAALDANGAVRHFNTLHGLVYGELDGGRSARIEALEAAFKPVNMEARASDGIVQEMWEKWMFIAALGGSNCLLRASVGDIVNADALDIAHAILDECAAIAAANGHAPRPEARQRMQAFMANADSAMTASMLKDVERHARIEGEQIIGDLIRRAPPGAPAPRLLPIVYANLRAYEVRRTREATSADHS